MTNRPKTDHLSPAVTIPAVIMLITYYTTRALFGEDATAKALTWYGDIVTRIIYPWMYGGARECGDVARGDT